MGGDTPFFFAKVRKQIANRGHGQIANRTQSNPEGFGGKTPWTKPRKYATL